jgi:hypothetical protein
MLVLLYLSGLPVVGPRIAHSLESVRVSAHKKASTADMTLLECDEQPVEAISPSALCEPHRKTRCLSVGSIRNCGSGGQEELTLVNARYSIL